MFTKKTKETLERNIGISLKQLSDLSADESRKLVENKIGKSLVFSKKQDFRKIGRGNPFLARKKFATVEEINAQLDAL